jgi:hypothetical protein
MAKKKVNTCPEYNILLNICQSTNGPCSEENTDRCELRPHAFVPEPAKPTKRKAVIKLPIIDVKPQEKKSRDLPPRPKFYTIEEQLRELGVEPNKTTQALDKTGEQFEVEGVYLDGEKPPEPTGKLIDPEEVAHWDDPIFIENSPENRPCPACHFNKYWHTRKDPRLLCAYCHPFDASTIKVLYAVDPKLKINTPLGKNEFIPEAYHAPVIDVPEDF